MASSLWTQVAKSSVASCRPTAMVALRYALGPTLRRSLMLSSRPAQKPILSPLRRRYATTALAAEADAAPSSQQSLGGDDMSDSDPLFSSLEGKIHPNTLKALVQEPFHYTKMSLVQAQILPLLPQLISSRKDNAEAPDLLVKARTGTGKTIGFLVPVVEARLKELEAVAAAAALSPSDGDPARHAAQVTRRYATDNIGALIISPTRELASQIVQEAQKLTAHHRGFETPLFVGGLDKYRQLRQYQRGRKDILVATPGRLRDMLQDPSSGVAEALKKTKMLVLDEADTLLDMGFRDDIEDIMRYLPSKLVRQTFLFSATVSESIKQIANTHLADNQLFINCVSADASPVHAHIPQYHTVLPTAKDQIPHLLRLIYKDQHEHGDNSKIIIFNSTTKMTELMTTLMHLLRSSCFARRTNIFELHSKRSMRARTNASDNFRNAKGASVLITSDVSARGVDYPGVTRVIQLGIPSKAEQYVHRVGRTGRGGSLVGRGDLLLLPWEYDWVRRNLSHIPLKPLTVNDFHEECEAALAPKEGEGQQPQKSAAHLVRYQDLERNIAEILPQLDEAAVGETMMSLLGFYVAFAGSMRMNAESLAKALQAWAVGGLGLSEAPYVSPQFLQRLGGGRSQRSSSGRDGRRSSSASSSFGNRREWRDNDGASSQRSSGRGFVRDSQSDRRPWERAAPRERGSGGGGYMGSGGRRDSLAGGKDLLDPDFSPFGGSSESDRRPWERSERSSERSSSSGYMGSRKRESYSSRPRSFDGDDESRSAPRYSSGKEREGGYQGRRTRSYEARTSSSSGRDRS